MGQIPATTVFPSPESPTGYAVRFCFFAPGRERVWVLGDWMFSDAARSTVTDSARIWPHEWKKGVFPHTLMGLKSTPVELKGQVPGEEIDVSKFEFDWDILKLGLYELERDGQGVFSRTVPLPSGVFNYRFVLDMPDGNPLRMVSVPDPAALPKTAEGEAGPLSQVYVPFDGARQADDRSIELPCPPGERGSVRYCRYPTDPAFGLGAEQTCAVYLPRGYEKARGKLPVLYLSHGGTDGLSAWVNQGSMPAILDNLIRSGRIPPMVVILMDNEAFRWNDREKCIPNLTGCLMPWAERTLPVADRAEGRAFAGLSAGGMLAFEVLEAAGDLFAAVGIWSGGQRFDADFDRPCLRHPKIHIGAGEYDDAHFAFSRPLAEKLAVYGIPCRECYPLGGHQWSVWRRLLEDFLTGTFPGPSKEDNV